jgi:predicted MPP superfamily phosphohydrolase
MAGLLLHIMQGKSFPGNKVPLAIFTFNDYFGGTMIEMNPGTAFSPVYLEVFSSAGRILVVLLAVFAQIYLFTRIRHAVRSTRRSGRFQSRAVGAAGAAIVLLSALGGVVLARPIAWVDPPAFVQILFFYLPAVWIVGSLCSVLILLFFRGAGQVGRKTARIRRELTGQSVHPSVDTGRRRFLQTGVGALAAAPFVLSGYGAAYAGRTWEVKELTLPFGRSLRVVQLTDIHAGLFMTRHDLKRYAEQVIALRPDLFVLTGDYITNSSAFLPECLEQMARIEARYGTFATLGNHDHWYAKPSEVTALFRQYRIPLLHNEHRIIETAEGPFAVAGIDDLYAGQPDLNAALHGLAPAIPTILLSHRPEIFPSAAERNIALTLAGHYHGGQIKLNLPKRPISVAHFRTSYPQGLYRLDNSSLYVSSGIGTSLTPIRLNAPPEVTLLHLT